MYTLIFNEFLSVTRILVAIIDILGAIPVIIELRQRAGHIQSEKASIAVLILMVVFLFTGNELLSIIGLDVSSFAIAGSLVIFIIAMEMILGVKFFKEVMPETISIVPLAFPLIAGAGTMTTLLSLKSQYQTQNILVGIVLNTMFVYLVLKNVGLARTPLRQNRPQHPPQSIRRNTISYRDKAVQEQYAPVKNNSPPRHCL